jgi:hypothetical protein
MAYATKSAFRGEEPHRVVAVYNQVQAHGAVSCSWKNSHVAIVRCSTSLSTRHKWTSMFNIHACNCKECERHGATF